MLARVDGLYHIFYTCGDYFNNPDILERALSCSEYLNPFILYNRPSKKGCCVFDKFFMVSEYSKLLFFIKF